MCYCGVLWVHIVLYVVYCMWVRVVGGVWCVRLGWGEGVGLGYSVQCGVCAVFVVWWIGVVGVVGVV